MSSNDKYPVSQSILKNNIIYDVTSTDFVGQPYLVSCTFYYKESNNTWKYNDPSPDSWPWYVSVDSLKLEDNDFISLDIEELKESRQSDGSLPEINCLKPLETSPLINAGTPVGIAYLGKAPELGAFEVK